MVGDGQCEVEHEQREKGQREHAIREHGGRHPPRPWQPRDRPPPQAIADEIETGRFEAEGEFFTMLGKWTLAVRIEGGGATSDEQAVFTLEAIP